MLKKIQINGKLFWDYYKLACGFVFGLASACLLFFDRSDFKIESCCSKVLAILRKFRHNLLLIKSTIERLLKVSLQTRLLSRWKVLLRNRLKML